MSETREEWQKRVGSRWRIFYAADRAYIKTTLAEDLEFPYWEILCYIEALESVAEAACEVWKDRELFGREVEDHFQAMYEKLAVVNFLAPREEEYEKNNQNG